ncbi:MAG TPA: heme-copper oxidase subunit III [Candidatus Acidoferrum sp.]|jgi:cytochrome c oxidase subunit 3
MPGTSVLEDIELIFENIGGGRGGNQPPAGGGDDGGTGNRSPRPGGGYTQRRYRVAITLAIVSILMFFLGLSTAFVVLRIEKAWIPIQLPRILAVNTVILLISSGTIELARKKLTQSNLPGFRLLWLLTTVLGVVFLAGQLIAWRQLVDEGVYIASNRASSFFYIFTGLHGLHLFCGVMALLYVALRHFERAKIARATAAQIVAHYWHFMDGLWLFLMALLYFGK